MPYETWSITPDLRLSFQPARNIDRAIAIPVSPSSVVLALHLLAQPRRQRMYPVSRFTGALPRRPIPELTIRDIVITTATGGPGPERWSQTDGFQVIDGHTFRIKALDENITFPPASVQAITVNTLFNPGAITDAITTHFLPSHDLSLIHTPELPHSPSQIAQLLNAFTTHQNDAQGIPSWHQAAELWDSFENARISHITDLQLDHDNAERNLQQTLRHIFRQHLHRDPPA